MDRRTYLVGLAAGISGVAGCMQNTGSEGDEPSSEYQGAPDAATATFGLGMIRISDAEIARQITYAIDGGTARKKQLATEVVTNGSATAEAINPPLENVERICHQDTVYRLSSEVTGSQTTTRYDIEFEKVAGDVPDSEVVPFEELPAVDRRKIAEEMSGAVTVFHYDETEEQASALVPTPSKSDVRWESGTQARLTIRKRKETNASRATYNYSVEEIGTAAEYGAAFRQQHEFELTGISAAERDIIERAINVSSPRIDMYYPISAENEPAATPSPAIRGLVDRFREHREKGFNPSDGGPSNRLGGSYLVRYDGQTYYTRLELDELEFEMGT